MKASIIKLLQERYFLPNEISWYDIAERVSVIYPPIQDNIQNLEFIPSSPTLMNCNTRGHKSGTLSSCFTMKIEDSIEGIFDAVKEAATVTKNGGGVGYDFSTLRSSSELVSGISRPSSGPLPFINIFNATLDGIMQGGVRRGAGMGMLDINHPNILDFIEAKSVPGAFTRLNFSIRTTDRFYEQLTSAPDTTWMVKDRTSEKEYPLKDKDGVEVTTQRLWDIIIDRAWATAEPGIFNSDIAFRQCSVTNVDRNVLSNPCSEYVSIPYGSCNLGSINLTKFVTGKKFDWVKFEEVIIKATRFLDCVIDANKFPIEKIKETTLKIRPVGLGYMGMAHALYKKEVPYNSEKGFKFIEEITRYLTLRSMQESIEMAKEHGHYEAFDYDTYMKANERFFNKGNCRELDIEQMKADIKKYGVRNSVTTSIAPTGSIGFIADASSGIEPVFALTYMRRIEKENKTHEVVYISDPIFEEYLNKHFNEEERIKIQENVTNNSGSCQKCDLLTEEQKKIFVVAGDITPMDHLEALARTAVNCSTSVSKTINLPKDISKEEVAKVYIEAYKKGIIGVTVYRDGCREGILIHKVDDRPSDIVYHHSPKRLHEMPCDVHRITYKGEKWIAFVGLFNDKPFEIFCGKVDEINLSKHIEHGKIIKVSRGHYSFMHDDEILIKDIAKTFNNEDNDDFARAISLSLRSGIMLEHLCDTLNKSKGDITKFSKLLARTLKHYIKDGTTASGKCEKCGSKLVYKDGCISCENPECGWSKCG